MAIRQTPRKKFQNADILVAGYEPQAAQRHEKQPEDNAAFVAKPPREQARRQRHERVTHVMRELHPGRLRLRQMQLVLEMFVHRIDHAVAEAPQQEQRRADEDKA